MQGVRVIPVHAVLSVMTAIGAVVGLAAAGVPAGLILALLVGLGGACVGLVVGLRRLEWFVLGVLAVRPLLDLLRVEAAGPFTPATLLGLVFLAVGGWWLLVRHREAQLCTPSPMSWALVALLTAASLSALVSVVPTISTVGVTRLASAVMMFWVLEQLLRSGDLRIQEVMQAVVVSAVGVAAYSGWQLATGSAPVDEYTGLDRVTGPFVHASVLAKYVALLLGAALAWAIWTRGVSRIVSLGALPVLSLLLVLTYTRGAWIAALVAVLVLLARWDWRALGLGVLSLVTAGVTIPAIYERIAEIWREPEVKLPGVPDNSLDWRIGYWQDLVPMARLSPVNGLGLDTVPILGGIDLAAHNVWVQTYVELGVVGVLAMVSVVVATAATVRAAGRNGSLAPPGPHRAAQEAAVAAAWCLFLMTPTENLLSETTTLWYGAVLLLCGTAPRPVSDGRVAVPSRNPPHQPGQTRR